MSDYLLRTLWQRYSEKVPVEPGKYRGLKSMQILTVGISAGGSHVRMANPQGCDRGDRGYDWVAN